MLAAEGGWSSALARALGEGVSHVPQARVATLEPGPAGGVIAVTSDGRRWRADGAVIATGPRAARALLAPLLDRASPLLAWLARVELRRTWTLAVAIEGEPDRRAFGVLQHVRDARTVSACAVHGAKLEHGAPAGRDVVLAWPTPDAAERLADAETAAIVGAMMPEVEALVPDVRGRVRRVRVYRTDEGTPLPRPGFAADRARGRALAAELGPAVRVAGDYLTMPMIEGAVASGEWAAALLAERLAPVAGARGGQ
jgi:protoporphyrinogen oxidase